MRKKPITEERPTPYTIDRKPIAEVKGWSVDITMNWGEHGKFVATLSTETPKQLNEFKDVIMKAVYEFAGNNQKLNIPPLDTFGDTFDLSDMVQKKTGRKK